MKVSFPVTCPCGETFLVHVAGTQFPKSAPCPRCDTAIWLVEPLGNVVGMAILSRAATEMKNGDWTLAIVLAAMAVECEALLVQETITVAWLECALLTGRQLARMLRSRLRIDVARDS
jgi:hypothetical protein